MPKEIEQLAFALKMNDGRQSFNFSHSAIIAFKFFHELSKKRVIDETYLEAILEDVRHA